MKNVIEIAALLGVILVMVTSLMCFGLIGCIQKPDTVGTIPSIASTLQSRVLKCAFTDEKDGWLWTTVYLAFKRAIEDRSNGRLKIELYPNDSLIAIQDVPAALQKGIADMGLCGDSYDPDKFIMTQSLMLPPLWKTTLEGTLVLHDMLNDPRYGFKEDMDKLGLYRFAAQLYAPYELFTMSKAAYKIEDLKGMRIRSNSTATTEYFYKMGAVPISQAAPETAQALQKGVLDGSVGNAAQIFVARGWYKYGQPGYVIDMGGLPSALISWCMNKNVYEGLAPDLQEIINEEGWNYLGYAYALTFDGYNQIALKKMLDHGNIRIVWSDDEKKRARDRVDYMMEEWANARDADGRPGSLTISAIKERFK